MWHESIKATREKHIRMPRFFPFMSLAASLLLPAHAADGNLNFQGVTGLLNIPSAAVVEEGRVELLYSNLLEEDRRIVTDWHYRDGVSLNAAIGLLDGVEVVLRDVGTGFDDASDMSVNLKWQLPWIPDDWFDLALGMQDVGGAASQYKAPYVAATRQFRYLQFTGGLSASDSPYGTLDGAFYGVEVTPYPWLSLLAEHDAADAHYGLRLATPEHWFSAPVQVSFTGLVSSSNRALDSDRFWGVSLSFPLGINQPRPRPHLPADSVQSEPVVIPVLPPVAPDVSPASAQPDVAEVVPKAPGEAVATASPEPEASVVAAEMLLPLRDRLVSHGFENVRVGAREREVVVVFENAIFNANSLDAVGLVAGEVVHRAPDGFQAYTVVMQRNGIGVLGIAGGIASYRAFLARGERLPVDVVVQQSPGARALAGVQWLATGGERTRFVPRVTLGPDSETVVGSEVGMFDYTLALNTELEFPLARGLSFYASHNTAVANSDDFDDGWYADRARETEWREAYLSQTFALSYNVTTMFQAGKTSYAIDEYRFGQNETVLHGEDGRYRLGLVMGRYVDEDTERDWSVMVGSLRYYWAGPDVSFRLDAGEFLNRDSGYKIESRHYFGDTQIALIYRDTGTQMVGMGVSIPLTPRKDMAPVGGFQLKGRPNLNFEMNTVVGEDRNPITFGVAEVPMMRNGIAARYHNFDRLSPAHVYRNAGRLRDAYDKYQ